MTVRLDGLTNSICNYCLLPERKEILFKRSPVHRKQSKMVSKAKTKPVIVES